jgi:hypothetical protein
LSSSSSFTTYSINIIDYSTDLFEEYFFASKLVVFEISRKNSTTFLLTISQQDKQWKKFKKNVAFSLSHTHKKLFFCPLGPLGFCNPTGESGECRQQVLPGPFQFYDSVKYIESATGSFAGVVGGGVQLLDHAIDALEVWEN